MRKTAVFLALVVLLLLGTSPALAQGIPKLPHAFFGSVTVNGAPAAAGTQVSATVDIGEIIPTQNPVNTVSGGYGISGNPYLLVQGYDIPDGATITFQVTNANGTATGGTAAFVAGGGPTEKNLSVTIEVPPPPSGNGNGVPAPAVTTVSITGLTATVPLRVNAQGIVQSDTTLTTADGKLSFNIPAGTKILDAQGNPLSTLTTDVDLTPPPPPEGANIIGLAYDFGPAGATFEPPITLEYTYDPADIPEDVAEEDLVIAYYDEEAGEWVELDGVVDAENDTITASIAHFTTFAIIGAPKPAAFSLGSLAIVPSEVAPGEKVNISVSVANTGGLQGSYTVVLKINGVKEAEKSATVAAGKSQDVSFSVAREDAGSYNVVVDGLSGTFTVAAPPLAPAAFSLSNLSIQPQEVKPKETVTITVAVANTGGTEGSYTVVLKIDGVTEAEKSVTVAAAGSETVSFPVSKEEAATYDVAVNGLSGSFTVAAVPPVPAKPAINWPLVGGIIAAVVVVGLLIFFVVRRRRAY